MGRLSTGGLAAAIWLATTLTGGAQTFPNRPLKFVVPLAAGTGTDLVARVIGERVSAELKQPVIVENVVGASGMVAAQQVVRAEPDGYTLFITSNTTHGANQSLFKRVPYDAVKDFTPIARIGSTPLILVVNPSLKVKTVAEFVALAKSKPGELNFGGGASSARVCSELFKSRTGIDVRYVPYRSIPAALNDVIGNQIAFTCADPSTAVPQIREDRVTALALSGTFRIALAPEIPTMQQAGVPDYDVTAYFAAFGPAKLPGPVVDRLYAAIAKAVKDPDVVAKLGAVGTEMSLSTPAELDALVKSEIVKWAKLISESGIEPQ